MVSFSQEIISSPLPQLDGNLSVLESEICDFSDTLSEIDDGLPIPIIQPFIQGVYCDPPAWYEQYRPTIRHNTAKMNNITVKRSNKQLGGISLPTVSVSNLRSLGPKLYSFKNDLIQREISVALCSEVWEKTNSKKYQFEIEKMLQMEGLKYISTPRTTKRGGGAAIIVNTEKFSLDKLDLAVPHNLEIVWGIIRPKKVISS